MSRLNFQLIGSNVSEALDELRRVAALLTAKRKPSEEALRIELEHAFHHLNVAWNCRRASTKRYAAMSDADFNLWSRFPKDIHAYQRPSQKKTGRRR